MCISFKPGRYFSTMWFIEGGPHNRDWLAAVFRDPGERWQLVYRFRYYNCPEPWDNGKDDKNWYKASMPPEEPEEKIVQSVDMMANLLVVTGFGVKVHRVEMRTDDDEVQAKKLMAQKWAHVRTEEEFKAKGPS